MSFLMTFANNYAKANEFLSSSIVYFVDNALLLMRRG